MSDTKRDKRMRTVGLLMAAELLLKQALAETAYEDKRTVDLLSVTQQSLSKTLLAAWEVADMETGG